VKKIAPSSTDLDWEKVFDLRCRSKRGEHLSENDRALLSVAYVADPARYASLNNDIFTATAPFGSRT
jgi:hypothetical protein